MSLNVTDDAARRRALDIDSSFIVQAPAGSGKTELLTQRLLALLAAVNRPEEILAITFTRKAAAEMRSRPLEALERAEGDPPEAEHALRTWKLARAAKQRDDRMGWHLLENPARLNVQTIDSFCSFLVRGMPWMTRFGGMPQIAEDSKELYREAADRMLARAGNRQRGGAEVRLLLRHLDNRMGRLREMLITMLQRRDQWLRHVVDPDPGQKRSALEDSLGSLIEDLLKEAGESLPNPCRDRLAELGRFAASNLKEEPIRPLQALQDLEGFPSARASEVARWRGLADLLLTSAGTLRRKVDVRCGFPAKGTDCREMKRLMEATLAEIPPEAAACWKAVSMLPGSAYAEEQWVVLEALLELLPLTVAELWVVFRQQNQVDFAEIALKALEALGQGDAPSDLLLRLDAAITHILVDEFQDTSCLQYELLRKLTEGWTPGDGRSLFLVGDPMQSIYRFREAEVGLFLQTRRLGLGSLRPVPLELKSNFRSQAGIVSWVNESFRLIFPARENIAAGAVPCTEADAALPPAEGEAVTIHPFVGRDDSAEAQRLGDLVEAARSESPEEVVAVLVRSRTHLPTILQELRRRGIPYQAQEIDLLENRPAARDVVSLTRALLHPGDRLAWLAVLRAPWCGLILKDLHALCGDTPEETIPDLLNGSTIDRLEEGRRRAERTGEILRQFGRRRGRVPLRTLVEGCWLRLGGPACYDRSGREDAGAVLDLLENLDRGGDLPSFEALDEGLKRLFAKVDDEADSRLQVMTIHRAKGLEFDTVILPGLGRLPARSGRDLLRWLEHPECGLLLAPLPPLDGTSRDATYDIIGRLEREKEDFEMARLFYVAATRARRRLHLIGHAGTNRAGEAVPERDSLLGKLWPAVAEHFRQTKGADPLPGPVEGVKRPLSRLPADWKLPVFEREASYRAPQARKASELSEEGAALRSFSDWTRTVARHVGTVVHAMLQRIAMEGLEKWSERPPADVGEGIRIRLLNLGVPPGRLDEAAERVRNALSNALENDRGRWILHPHREGACELPLSGITEGQVVHAVIDRTFVDGEGVRWIIDYKTGEEPDGDRERFLDREEERYREQLKAYAILFRALEPDREVRTALYYPLLGWWREISLSSKQNGQKVSTGRSG